MVEDSLYWWFDLLFHEMVSCMISWDLVSDGFPGLCFGLILTRLGIPALVPSDKVQTSTLLPHTCIIWVSVAVLGTHVLPSVDCHLPEYALINGCTGKDRVWASRTRRSGGNTRSMGWLLPAKPDWWGCIHHLLLVATAASRSCNQSALRDWIPRKTVPVSTPGKESLTLISIKNTYGPPPILSPSIFISHKLSGYVLNVMCARWGINRIPLNNFCVSGILMGNTCSSFGSQVIVGEWCQ